MRIRKETYGGADGFSFISVGRPEAAPKMRDLGKAIEQAVNEEKQEVLEMLYDEIIKKETALAREWEFLSKQLPISGVRMDCASCDHKEICDEVVELKVSHFQNIK